MKKVLLIDSGSGGLNVLCECIKVSPNCDFLFFCDNKNLPYGNKTKEHLQEITLKNLQNIYKFFNFEIVILACNTLTSTCLEICRQNFSNVVFIGTVPAIKPALEKFEAKDILVLATETTIKHNISINKNPNMQLMPMENLASKIDENLDELELLQPEIEKCLKDVQAKAVVLGCTHYKAVEQIIVDVLGKEVEVFDASNGVARRLKSFVDNQTLNYQVQIVTSGNESFLPKLWWRYEKLMNM